MKKIFLLYGHYDDKTFNAAIKNTFTKTAKENGHLVDSCLLYTSPSPRDGLLSRMPSSA